MSNLAESVVPTADVGRLAIGCHVQVYWREYEEWFDGVVRVRAGRAGADLAVARARADSREHARFALRAPRPAGPQAYRDSRHHVVYEDGQEDVGIIDGRSLWLFEDDKWSAMRLRWKDDDVRLVLNEPSAHDKAEAEAQRDNGDGKKPAAAEAKDDAQHASGWPATSENAAGGFMIGCDMCGTAQRPRRKPPRSVRRAARARAHLGAPPLSRSARPLIDKWYYGWSVDITEHEAKDIKKYVCPKCVIEGARKRGGKGTNKRLRTVAAKIQG